MVILELFTVLCHVLLAITVTVIAMSMFTEQTCLNCGTIATANSLIMQAENNFSVFSCLSYLITATRLTLMIVKRMSGGAF